MRYLFRKPKAFILNDTRRDTSHVGCQLVMQNIQILCQQCGIQVIGTETSKAAPREDDFIRQIKEADIIILNGEGTLHHDRGEGLYRQVQISCNIKKPVALINSVWQDNKSTKKYLRLFDIHSFRESTSAELAKLDGAVAARCVPDLSLYSKVDAKSNLEKKVVFTDSVIKDASLSFKALAKEIGCHIYPMHAKAKNPLTINRLMKHSFVVGGRFHALCLSMLTGKPMISLESNTHKISALLYDLQVDVGGYMFLGAHEINKESVYGFMEKDHSVFLENSRVYVKEGRRKAVSLFKDIKSLA